MVIDAASGGKVGVTVFIERNDRGLPFRRQLAGS